jgi:hypothetical protein
MSVALVQSMDTRLHEDGIDRPASLISMRSILSSKQPSSGDAADEADNDEGTFSQVPDDAMCLWQGECYYGYEMRSDHSS